MMFSEFFIMSSFPPMCCTRLVPRVQLNDIAGHQPPGVEICSGVNK